MNKRGCYWCKKALAPGTVIVLNGRDICHACFARQVRKRRHAVRAAPIRNRNGKQKGVRMLPKKKPRFEKRILHDTVWVVDNKRNKVVCVIEFSYADITDKIVELLNSLSGEGGI